MNPTKPVDNVALRIIPEWKQLCAYLAAYLKPEQLELAFIGHVKRPQTADEFLSPLLQLPRLKSCSIRFGPYRNDFMQMRVKQTVDQVTGEQPVGCRFAQFFDLPVEIQQKILLYTYTVVPCHFQWVNEKQMFVREECLWTRACGVIPYGGSHYCPSNWVSYSSLYMPHGLPIALFQASQQLKVQAEYVFYTQNRFILDIQGPQFYSSSSSLPTSWKPEISQFLHPFPPECLHLIRHLRWRFPEMNDTCFLPEQTMTVDFINAIDFIARLVQHSAFTLILDLSYDEEHLYAFPGIDNPSKILRMKLALYRRIIELVTPRLRGLKLKDFFVHISWPIENQL